MKNLRHYRNTATCTLIAFILAFWLFGCESRTASLMNEEEMVTKSVLEQEFQFLSEQLDTNINELKLEYQKRLEDLARQNEIKQAITDAAAAVSQDGTLNPVGIATLIAAILGIGSFADNRKKDGIITGLKSK